MKMTGTHEFSSDEICEILATELIRRGVMPETKSAVEMYSIVSIDEDDIGKSKLKGVEIVYRPARKYEIDSGVVDLDLRDAPKGAHLRLVKGDESET